jgi:arylamine N-acetyltransferase
MEEDTIIQINHKEAKWLAGLLATCHTAQLYQVHVQAITILMLFKALYYSVRHDNSHFVYHFLLCYKQQRAKDTFNDFPSIFVNGYSGQYYTMVFYTHHCNFVII